MGKRTEETFTVQVTVENVRTGAAQTTKFCGGTDGMLEVTETKVNGGCTSAMKILRAVLGDGDGNYHLITTERAGGSEEGLQVVQKRSRELMSEDDARYWALENLRMEEYEKAFPNE